MSGRPRQSLSADEMAASLERDYGIPRQRASELAARVADGSIARQTSGALALVEPSPVSLPVELPFRLTIPWSLLVSDNDKYGVRRGQMWLTAPYRDAKAAIRKKARNLIGSDRTALAQPLDLRASVYLPDRRPHDTSNFSKCAHDALATVVYEDDKWLYRTTWERAGVDVDAPRAEITIRLWMP